MRKLTQKEISRIPVKVNSNTENAEIYRAIRELSVGEGIEVKRSEWKIKTSPNSIIPGLRTPEGKKFSVRLLQDSSGWLFIRSK